MSKLYLNPGTLLAPVPPALVSCGDMEHPNLLTVAWTGIVNTHPPMVYVSIRPERYSYGLIEKSGEFVINLPPAALVRAVDLCGVRSGRDVNKWEISGLTPIPSSKVSAPTVEQCPLALECRVERVLPLGSHTMFLARIVALAVEGALVDKSGRLDLAKGELAAYAHGEYFALGKKIGSFGFSVKKKPTKKRGAPPAKNSGKNHKKA